MQIMDSFKGMLRNTRGEMANLVEGVVVVAVAIIIMTLLLAPQIGPFFSASLGSAPSSFVTTWNSIPGLLLVILVLAALVGVVLLVKKFSKR